METEQRSAISVVFVLLVAGTMTAVAVAPDGGTAAPQVNATNDTTATGTTISVSATGDAQAEPDVAVLHLESAATASEPRNASDRLAANVSRLRAALLEANVSEDRIRTTAYDLYDESDRGGPERDVNESRYVARQTIAVDVSNTSRVGTLVDVAVANGATGVNGVEFTLSEESQSELRNQALEEAMGSARTQAEALAATESIEITGVESISTDSDGPRPFAQDELAAATEADTQIDSGPVTVRATVHVTYNATG